jgi:hypothetical protein
MIPVLPCLLINLFLYEGTSWLEMDMDLGYFFTTKGVKLNETFVYN